MDVLNDIIQSIQNSKKIAILYHVSADGDAIGSSLALYLAFCSSDKTIDVFGEEEVPNQLKFLPGSDEILIGEPNHEVYDLVILIDSGDIHRLGKRAKLFESAKFTINIDHHKSNTINADINYLDVQASACGEMVYKLIKHSMKEVDKDIANCLYTAIVTDSGSFKFSNTTPQTHRIAANLIDKEVKPDEISRQVFENIPFSKLQLLGEIFNNTELNYNNKVAVLYTTFEQLNRYNISVESLDNVANYGISIENVELSIFLREENDGKTKVSFRSKRYFDCAEFANIFNGGGHCRAAGCVLDMPLFEAGEEILSKVKDFGI